MKQVLTLLFTAIVSCMTINAQELILSHSFRDKMNSYSQLTRHNDLSRELNDYENLVAELRDKNDDSLKAQAFMQYAMLLSLDRQYKRAFEYANKFIDLYDDIIKDSTDLRQIDAGDAISIVFSSCGKVCEAIDIQEKALSRRKLLKNDESSENYCYAILNLATNYYAIGNYKKCELILSQLKEKLEHTKKNRIPYAFCLRMLGQNSLALSSFDKAESLELEANKLFKKNQLFDDDGHNTFMISLALAREDFYSALEYAKRNVEITDSIIDSKSKQHVGALLTELECRKRIDEYESLAPNNGKFVFHDTSATYNLQDSIGKLISDNNLEYTFEGIEYLRTLIEHKKESIQTSSFEESAKSLRELERALGIRKCMIDNSLTIDELIDYSLIICDSLIGKNNILYGEMLRQKSETLCLQGDINAAINYANLYYRTMKHICNGYRKNSPIYASALVFASNMYVWDKRYDEAIGMCEYAKDIYVRCQMDSTIGFSGLMQQYGYIYESKGDRSKAMLNYENAANIIKKYSDKFPNEYAACLVSLLRCSNISKMSYTKLIREMSDLMTNHRLKMRVQEDFLLQMSSSLALHNTDQSLNVLESLLTMYQEKSENQEIFRFRYLSALQVKASLLYKQRRYPELLTLCNNAIDIYNKQNTNKTIYADYQYFFLKYKYYVECMQGSENASNTLSAIVKCTQSTQSPSFAKKIEYSNFFYTAKEYQQLCKIVDNISENMDSVVIDLFAGLSPSEREETWRTYSSWYLNSLPVFSANLNNDKIIEATYDGLLFAKGLLLNIEQTFNDRITDCKDEKIKAKQMRLNNLKRECDRILKIIDEGQGDYLTKEWLSLSEEIHHLERDISTSISQGFVKEYYSTRWKDVRKALSDSDIAIEYVAIPENSGSIVYYAYTLKKEYNVPHVIKLFDEDKLSKTEVIDDDAIELFNEEVWGPLSEELDGVNNIYFSPYGILHNLPIESTIFLNRAGCKDMKAYRLSSTKQLVTRTKSEPARNYTLWGDIDFGADSLQIINNSINCSDDILDQSHIRSADKIYPLPYTKAEIESIKIILDSLNEVTYKLPSTVYSDTLATESAFKRLSGQKTRIIHLATHGFNNVSTSPETNNKGIMSYSAGMYEDYILGNTGLLLAGANYSLAGGLLPGNVDDGILASNEISNLDFRETEIVTLSACDTGLGTISSDGVFGLQRGFKKAGANSLLMSLWKVDDKATCKLMTEFYSNWIGKKMTKHDALEAAKKTVRETKGWEEAKYWAAFILLDGLD